MLRARAGRPLFVAQASVTSCPLYRATRRPTIRKVLARIAQFADIGTDGAARQAQCIGDVSFGRPSRQRRASRASRSALVGG